MMKQTIDSISFHMKEACDFSFLSNYGKVFCVFAQNDSGNISFGVVNNNGNKYFIKVAGAETEKSCRSKQEAIETLKNAVPLYQTLKHSNLIELLEHYFVKDLYVAVFKWAEGDCLFDHWNFEMYSQNPHMLPPKLKFQNLPVEYKRKAIDVIFEFLSLVESKGYVAVDFYDGSIMYDFIKNTVTICDIDFFRKTPVFNDTGIEFIGTKRLKSPEEYTLGAAIDSVTNVFTLGALLFHFFGMYSKEEIKNMSKNNAFSPCEFESWELSRQLYEVTLKAVNRNREERYGSINEFYAAWINAQW